MKPSNRSLLLIVMVFNFFSLVVTITGNDFDRMSSFLNEKEREMLDVNHLNFHPCFNKGFYDTEFNMTGIGSLVKCYEIVKQRWNCDSNCTRINNEETEKLKDSNRLMTIDSNFRNFKFLFYQKESEEEVNQKDIDEGFNIHYTFNPEMKFQTLVDKVKDICSKSYSILLTDLNKFRLKNISKLCFDLTCFLLTLEFKGANNSTTLIMQMNLNSKVKQYFNHPTQMEVTFNQHDSRFHLFFTSQSIFLLILLIISFTISTYQFLYPDMCLSIFTKKTIAFHGTLDESSFEEVITYSKVKNYLFIEDNCYFKKKYGKDFEVENYDNVLIKNEIIEMVNNNLCDLGMSKEKRNYMMNVSEDVRALIIETQNSNNEFRGNLLAVFVHFSFISIFAVCMWAIIARMNDYYGEEIVALIMIMLVLLLMILSLKWLMKNEQNKEETRDSLCGET